MRTHVCGGVWVFARARRLCTPANASASTIIVAPEVGIIVDSEELAFLGPCRDVQHLCHKSDHDLMYRCVGGGVSLVRAGMFSICVTSPITT